jgi:hypothetical protein
MKRRLPVTSSGQPCGQGGSHWSQELTGIGSVGLVMSDEVAVSQSGPMFRAPCPMLSTEGRAPYFSHSLPLVCVKACVLYYLIIFISFSTLTPVHPSS